MLKSWTLRKRSDPTRRTCYRAKARLLRLKRAPLEGELVDSPEYQSSRVEQRSKQDDSYQSILIVSAIVAGVAAGVTVGVVAAASR